MVIKDRINRYWQDNKTKLVEALTKERDSDFADEFLAGAYYGVAAVVPMWLKSNQKLLKRSDQLSGDSSFIGSNLGDFVGAMIWFFGTPVVAFNVASTGTVIAYEKIRDQYQGFKGKSLLNQVS